MSIFPLPVFEADVDPRHREALSDEEIYASLKPPTSMVVRFGAMKLIGEYAYDGEARPGCGSRLVVRTHRGTELATMLTTTCSNSGCSKSISRQEMREYIENSGGSEYPFYDDGRILRVATIEDLNRQSALDGEKPALVAACRAKAAELGVTMKIVDAEPILGGELLTFYYLAEQRVDFRELVRALAARYQARIEMRQVGARDEARLVADYERCGQHCCCKNFLKVLKPVSMKSAKVQKATLDPLKISGRCGRLMCCLRYEDQTYEELKAKLPKKNKRVGTSEGPGVVVDSKILVQLVLVRLEHNQQEIAVPVEELMDPENCPAAGSSAERSGRGSRGDEPEMLRGLSAEEAQRRVERGHEGTGDPGRYRNQGRGRDRGRDRGRGREPNERQQAFRDRAAQQGQQPGEARPDQAGEATRREDRGPRRRRRRRRDRGGGGGDNPAPEGG